MRKKRIYLFGSLLCIALSGCIHEYPDKTSYPEPPEPTGLTLTWTSDHPDELADIRLWTFDGNDLLVEEQRFADIAEARQAKITLPATSCRLVAATCPASHYTCAPVVGTTRLADLLITVNTSGSNPPHIQSGTAVITAETENAGIHLTRILSEMEFTLTNLPADIVKVRAEVLNSADGFYPGTVKLTDRNTTVLLGELAPDAGGNVRFPLTRLMPVTNVPAPRAAQPPTRMKVEFTNTKGEIVAFDVEAPTMESDGHYNPEAGYEQFKVGTVVIATIKDWGDGNNSGEEGDVH